MIQSSHGQKIEIVANRKFFMNIKNRIDGIEEELKRVVYTDALNMEKLAGLKMMVELLQAVND